MDQKILESDRGNYTDYFSNKIRRAAISEGVTPATRAACPKVAGLTFVVFPVLPEKLPE